MVKDRKGCPATVHGFAKNWTQLSNSVTTSGTATEPGYSKRCVEKLYIYIYEIYEIKNSLYLTAAL